MSIQAPSFDLPSAVTAQTTTFIIGRHGKTSFNAEGRICGGGSNPELTEEGRKEAEELGTFLDQNYPDICGVMYCSNQDRASETAKIVAEKMKGKIGLTISTPEFREIDHGESEGILASKRKEDWKQFVEQHIAKFQNENPNQEIDPFLKWKITPYYRGAETYEHLINRVSDCLIRIAKEAPNRQVVVIAHNAVMQGLIMRSLYLQNKLEKGPDGLYPIFFEASLIPNCGVSVFECNPQLQEHEDRIKFINNINYK